MERASTLPQMIMAAWQVARVIAIYLVEHVLEKRAQEPTQWPQCPKCGARLQSKGFVSRQIESIVGCITWKRRVGRCPNRCSIGVVAPLDQALGLLPDQRTSVELKKIACALAVFVPFETAATLLSLILGIPISTRTIWLWVQQTGELAMEQLQRELEQLSQGIVPEVEILTEALAFLPLLLGADGVMVPFRPHGGYPQGKQVWREIKVAVLARWKQYISHSGKLKARLEQRRLVAVLGDMEALSWRLMLEAIRQGIQTARLVVWLSDGARGLWRLYSERLTTYAIGVLDFYHAAQHLWKGAAAWFDGRTKQARWWYRAARHRMRHGQHMSVLAEISQALAEDELSEPIRQALMQLYTYLDKHREHIDYARFKELGLPLGSGFVESACKWLIQQRFKGVGMRWSEEGFNHLLHLRLAWVNGRFDSLFPMMISPM